MLGTQTQAIDAEVVRWAIRARVRYFKLIAHTDPNGMRAIKAEVPECEFVYRPFYEYQDQALEADPIEAARRVYSDLMHHLETGLYRWCEGLNECGLWHRANAYSDFTCELARRLHSVGFHGLLAYSFSVDNPAVPGWDANAYRANPEEWKRLLAEQWRPYLPGLREADGLALHEYRVPWGIDELTLFRHRLVYEVLPEDLKSKPLLITETGYDDHGNPNTDGWRSRATPEEYATFIRFYGEQLQESRRIGLPVLGSIFFETGGGFPSFEMLGYDQLADAMREVNSVKEVHMPQFVLGFGAKAQQLGSSVVGQPAEDEWYRIEEKLDGTKVKVATQRTTTGYFQTEEVPAGSGNWREPQFFSAASPKA